jgi:hypothetical protein
MYACACALFPKKHSGVQLVNPAPQLDNQLSNFDPHVFRYGLNQGHLGFHSHEYRLQYLVNPRRSSIRSYSCNQEFGLSSNQNRIGRHPRKEQSSAGAFASSFLMSSQENLFPSLRFILVLSALLESASRYVFACKSGTEI